MIKNSAICPFLEEMKIDTFSLGKIDYPGVVYLFARNINDSNFIHILPFQCVFSEEELVYSFYFSDKLYIGTGELNILENIFNFQKGKVDINSDRTWKLCDEIGYPDIYDPKGISLFIDQKSVKKVSLSAETVKKIIFGDMVPPPPPYDIEK